MKLLLLIVLAAVAGCSDPRHDQELRDNQKFADECNERGGKAEFTFAARQCIGLVPKTKGADRR